MTQLQHAAAITGRVRRAGALTTINQQLETLVFDLSHSPSREAAPLRLRMDATARFPEQAAAAWEAPALDEALNLLRLERALVAERGVDSTFLALNTIIDALKSLPEDEDGGEAASVPAWPPPKPPFRMGAEQRLDA